MKLILGVLMLVLGCVAYAVDPSLPPDTSEIMAFFAQLGGLKGASALVIAGIVVQGLMLAVRSFLGDLIGQYKLLLVLGLSLVSGVVALMVSGVPLGAALVHSTTLAAFSVFFNQIYKQFFEKKS